MPFWRQSKLNQDIIVQLQALADKYECAAFMEQDPSRVLQRYTKAQDLEVAAFISAMLAFGRRDLFLPKIDSILELADAQGGPFRWLITGQHQKDFPPAGVSAVDSFYRFYSYHDLHLLFCRLEEILQESGSLGSYFHHTYIESQNSHPQVHLSQLVSQSFPDCKIVPKGKNSANKRVQMFLRWMVRQNSPVDVGLWNWYSPADLLIPLDTHVIRQSVELGLLSATSTKGKSPSVASSASNARKLTEVLAQIWPEDPCKGDFALFGLGIDKAQEKYP